MSLLNEAIVQPPVPVDRWSAVGPGIGEKVQLLNSSSSRVAFNCASCQLPPMKRAVVPAAAAAFRSS